MIFDERALWFLHYDNEEGGDQEGEDVQLIIEEQDDARFKIIELPSIHLSPARLKEYYDLLRKPR